MHEIHPDELDELAGLFYFIQGAVQERTASEWIRSDLSAAQFKTMFVVFTRGPLSVTEISEMLEVGQPTASHLVEKLVQAGLVERIENPQDRRAVQVRTLPAGEELANSLWRGRREFMRSWLQRLSDEDAEALRKGLTALQRVALQDAADRIEREGKDK
ncbi:MAG TPA: MarR family transcriptional regulator [Aggregatilineales bacterium]|nr:MarR family transcriptional regulator [Aggregatilineales bacterium]